MNNTLRVIRIFFFLLCLVNMAIEYQPWLVAIKQRFDYGLVRNPDNARLMTHAKDRPIPQYFFSPDSKSMLYIRDKEGDEIVEQLTSSGTFVWTIRKS